MASNAAELASLLSGDTFVVNNTTEKVGVGSTTPTEALTVVGVVSATSFFGDGSNLEGVASAGLGTALGEVGSGGLEVVYYTDKILNITETVTVDPPASTNVAYTQYSEVAVADTKDLIVAPGDDFIPDILGLSTEGVEPLGGSGGRVRADQFTSFAGNGPPTFPSGANVTGNLVVGSAVTMNSTGVNVVGVVTATSFKGDGSSLSNLPASGLSSARVYTFNQLFS